MELNATLFAQLVHFILAYILLDYIVLRLATAIVKAEDRKLGALEGDTAEHEKRIISRIRYNEDDWLILQKRLQSECPTVQVGQHIQAPHEGIVSCLAPSTEHINELVFPLKKMLVTTIMEQERQHD